MNMNVLTGRTFLCSVFSTVYLETIMLPSPVYQYINLLFNYASNSNNWFWLTRYFVDVLKKLLKSLTANSFVSQALSSQHITI